MKNNQSSKDSKKPQSAPIREILETPNNEF